MSSLAQRFMPKQDTLNNQDRLLSYFIAVSVALHVFFWIAQGISSLFWTATPPPMEEWSMDADLVTDLKFSAPSQTALPNAQVAPEATVPSQLLPQLPKKFEVKQAEKSDESVAEDKVEPDPKTEAEKKQAQAPVTVPKEDVEEKNRITMDDALKRLAVERLRQEQKDKQVAMKAPKVDELARLKEELAQRPEDLNSGVKGSGSKAGQDRYRGMLQKAVGRHYALPEAYNMKNASLRVVVAIVVNDRGELISCTIHQSSGDKLFDNLAYKAVKDAAPLPRPPDGQAGEAIYLHFTPKSF